MVCDRLMARAAADRLPRLATLAKTSRPLRRSSMLFHTGGLSCIFSISNYISRENKRYIPPIYSLEIAMIDFKNAPYSPPLPRPASPWGRLFLAHDALKVFVFTPAGTAKFFGSVGVPAELAYIIMIAEALAGIALILGVWTRWVALLATPILLGAIFTVHGAA